MSARPITRSHQLPTAPPQLTARSAAALLGAATSSSLPPRHPCQLGRRPVGARGYCWRVDTREAAQQWADEWERGWREHEAAAIAALYAEGAFWQQHPFRVPEPGYLSRVFAEEESAQCRFGTPIVDGDQAAVPWTARTRLTDCGTDKPAGTSLLRLSAHGLGVEEPAFWPQS